MSRRLPVSGAPYLDDAARGLFDALDTAIAALRGGEALDEALPASDAYSLRPLLEIAALAHMLAPAAGNAETSLAKARVRGRVMAAAQAQLAERHGWLENPALRPAALAATAASTAIALAGSGAAVASANALPGEPLYSVKLAVEETRAAMARAAGDEAARAALESELAQRRLAEAQLLAERGRDVPVELIQAAERHATAAESAAAQVAEPRRGQVAAQLSANQSQREETLNRLLDTQQVPPPARTAIAQAIEQGAARKHETERQGNNSRGDERRAAPTALAQAAQHEVNPTPAPLSPLATSAPATTAAARLDERREDRQEERDDRRDDKDDPDRGNSGSDNSGRGNSSSENSSRGNGGGVSGSGSSGSNSGPGSGRSDERAGDSAGSQNRAAGSTASGNATSGNGGPGGERTPPGQARREERAVERVPGPPQPTPVPPRTAVPAPPVVPQPGGPGRSGGDGNEGRGNAGNAAASSGGNSGGNAAVSPSGNGNASNWDRSNQQNDRPAQARTQGQGPSTSAGGAPGNGRGSNNRGTDDSGLGRGGR